MCAVYIYSIRVRVVQWWEDGRKLDRRASAMQPDRSVTGHRVINTVDGTQYAAVEASVAAVPAPDELLPRLWVPTVVSCRLGRLTLRGVQRQGGRVCQQEWECVILNRQN